MTELKTLNNLRIYKNPIYEGGYDYSVSITELKQEVIKWIKAEPDDIFFSESRIEGWIKHFFNITDEELK